jgi:guanylate kinase
MTRSKRNQSVEEPRFSRSDKLQLPCDRQVKPLIIVISGLSGAGKDAVLVRMKQLSFALEYITTVTTRARRANERDKVDYHFVSEEEFQAMVKNGRLLEWANVYGNWYGVPYEPVKQALEKGQDTIIKVDVQGAATLKKILPGAIFIFVTPPSMDDLARRLKGRRTESASELTLRLKTAAKEIKQLSLFDYIVVNEQDKLDQVVSDIEAIITAEKCRVNPRKCQLPEPSVPPGIYPKKRD